MDVLIVFARAPQVGRCKTRLIPELGEVAATELHTQMTRRTLDWARGLARCRELAIEVHFGGGTASQMAAVFGQDLDYVPQTDGDLGSKLKAAFQRERAADTGRMVVVGTDCPQLTIPIGEAAFSCLTTHPICLAPATDGGYVLLGINTALAPGLTEVLFESIDWGSADVLAQTLTQIERSEVACALLPTLADVDTPADLEVWHQAVRGEAVQPPRISVVIPTYNEEPALEQTVASAQIAAEVEIIVVAGGRFHSSLRMAAEKRIQCLVSSVDRGTRMNLGVELASAEVVLFVHADTLLPQGYLAAIEQLLAESANVGGAFQLHIDSPRQLARWVERGVGWRSQWRSMPYGDQAIFVRRQVFVDVGGYRSQPIMEDYEFVRRLRRAGQIAIADERVRTSARRWERRGFVRSTLINQFMLLGYHLGVPLSRLAQFYRGS